MPSRTFMLMLLCIIAPCSSAVDKIIISGLFKDKAVVIIDGKQSVLSAGTTSPEGVKLISSDSSKAVLEINGMQQTYGLGTHISGNFTGPEAGETVTIAPDNGGMYLVNGSINDFQVGFVVDTGSTFIAMNKSQAQRIGLNYKMEGVESMTETASGYSKIYLVKLKEVKVGNITVRDVDGAVHDDEFPKEILLGNSFLSRVTMNREGMLLQIKDK